MHAQKNDSVDTEGRSDPGIRARKQWAMVAMQMKGRVNLADPSPSRPRIRPVIFMPSGVTFRNGPAVCEGFARIFCNLPLGT
jgi:hypothetical protein